MVIYRVIEKLHLVHLFGNGLLAYIFTAVAVICGSVVFSVCAKVLKTNDTWYGMTYHEDVAAVKDSFKKMLENGVYKADLFSDL